MQCGRPSSGSDQGPAAKTKPWEGLQNGTTYTKRSKTQWHGSPPPLCPPALREDNMNSFEPAHSPFGGSVATRVLRCPASGSLVEKGPAHLRKVSADAERGTACHIAMALLIENVSSFDDLIGKTIDGYTITADDVGNALRPAYAYAEQLLDAPGAEFYLEQRVVFPTIPGAFGTVDLII